MADNIFATPHQPFLHNAFNDAFDLISDNRSYMSANGGSSGTESQVSTLHHMEPQVEMRETPYVEIVEEPQGRALRFRYECEGRSAGSIPGVNSTADNRTFPAIKVVGHRGPAFVVVSCVTVEKPHKPHPHKLVGREGCRNGICTMQINNDSMECMFSNLGIQCVKRRDVEQALKVREDQRVDPFRTGFTHRSQPQNIDLNAVRLCFQVFLEDSERGRFTHPLQPVVSQPIYDKKAISDLVICKLSDCTSTVAGGKDIILLCDKVSKDDIQVRFYEERNNQVFWEGFGEFQAADVHKQVAISFKTPKYANLDIENSVKVYIQLVRKSDQMASVPLPFEYLPLDSDPAYVRRKMAKYGNPANDRRCNDFIQEFGGDIAGGDGVRKYIHAYRTNPSNPRHIENVKVEPADQPLTLSPVDGNNTLHSPYQGRATSGGGIMFPPMPQQGVQVSAQGFAGSPMFFPMPSTSTHLPLNVPPHLILSPNMERTMSISGPAPSGMSIPAQSPVLATSIHQQIIPGEPNVDLNIDLESQDRESAMDSDLRKINSAELVGDLNSSLIQDFSNSLTFSDSIAPNIRMNQDSACNLPLNIPQNSEGDGTSDSFQNLASEIEKLNNSIPSKR